MRPAVPVLLLAAAPGAALAHAAEQGFVLLLPTRAWIASGVATVALTVLLVSLLPGRAARGLFAARDLGPGRPLPGRGMAALAGFLAVPALLAAGLLGPRDPGRNLLPLTVWTVFWVGFPVLHALAGDLWRHANPWRWPAAMLRRAGLRPCLRPPAGVLPALGLASFLAFAAVLLAHPAPTDPRRLAAMVAGYWAFHLAGALLCGPRWLRRAEGFALFLAACAALAPLAREGGRWRLGLPGWRLLVRPDPGPLAAVFPLAMLAVGSFDGFNETFTWVALLGLNPLEFPGRSFVVLPNLAGLLLSLPALLAVFALTLAAGLALAGRRGTGAAVRALAPALLPIALGYHVAHYLPSTLVEAQQVAAAVVEPLGLGHVHVTTGFFGTLATVRTIWLAQAGAVVAGHVLAVLLGHALALRHLGQPRAAALSQLPLAAFMVGYTLFGLWLLATPRGV
ncbi:MAG: hypothetical protein N2Z62_05890 [Rhodobacteraceae bacterium]|nr:hypothetical protein [Paracoccaceae bacterium]